MYAVTVTVCDSNFGLVDSHHDDVVVVFVFFALFNSIDAVHYDRPEYGRFKDAFFDNMGRLRIRLPLFFSERAMLYTRVNLECYSCCFLRHVHEYAVNERRGLRTIRMYDTVNGLRFSALRARQKDGDFVEQGRAAKFACIPERQTRIGNLSEAIGNWRVFTR